MIAVELDQVLIAGILAMEFLRVMGLDEVVLKSHSEQSRDETLSYMVDWC